MIAKLTQALESYRTERLTHQIAKLKQMIQHHHALGMEYGYRAYYFNESQRYPYTWAKLQATSNHHLRMVEVCQRELQAKTQELQGLQTGLAQ